MTLPAIRTRGRASVTCRGYLRCSHLRLPGCAVRVPSANRVWISGAVKGWLEQGEGGERAGFRDRSRLVEIRGVELAVARYAEERQADPYLLLEDLERALEPGLPRRGQAQALQPAEPHALRAENDRLDHVGAAHEAAVHHDRGAARDRRHHLGKHVVRVLEALDLVPG